MELDTGRPIGQTTKSVVDCGVVLELASEEFEVRANELPNGLVTPTMQR